MSAAAPIPAAEVADIAKMIDQVIAWYLRRTRGVTRSDLTGAAWVEAVRAYRLYDALSPERQTSPAAAFCRRAVVCAVRNEIVGLLSSYRHGSLRARKVVDMPRVEFEAEATVGVSDPEEILLTRRAAARALALVEQYPLAARVLAGGERPSEVARAMGASIESVYRETAEARRAARSDHLLACYLPHRTC